MSKHQPTIKDLLLKRLQFINETIDLLNKHEKSWGADEQYTAKWIRKQLKKQQQTINDLIENCEE